MTGSMEPDYNIGDLIITKEINQENIKKGDIILTHDAVRPFLTEKMMRRREKTRLYLKR